MCSGFSINTIRVILGDMERTLVVDPFRIYLIYNLGLLIHRVDTEVFSSIRISAYKSY